MRGCSGIWSAVEGRVLIYPHKERVLEAVKRRCPALRYVMVDDKPRLLLDGGTPRIAANRGKA